VALAGFAGALAGMLYASNVRSTRRSASRLEAFPVALSAGPTAWAASSRCPHRRGPVEVLSVRYAIRSSPTLSPFLCLLAMLLVRPWGSSDERKSWSALCDGARWGLLKTTYDGDLALVVRGCAA